MGFPSPLGYSISRARSCCRGAVAMTALLLTSGSLRIETSNQNRCVSRAVTAGLRVPADAARRDITHEREQARRVLTKHLEMDLVQLLEMQRLGMKLKRRVVHLRQSSAGLGARELSLLDRFPLPGDGVQSR